MSQPLQQAIEKFQKTFDHLQQEFSKLQTGRANAAVVEHVMVESDGAKMPLKAVASISIPESNQIAIQPWNRDQLVDIERAIKEANIGLNPQNNGVLIRLVIPALTEERRKELVKLVHHYAEDARISIRNARQEAMAEFKKAELSEDELHGKEAGLQKQVDEFNKKVDEASKKKEQ